MTEKNYDNFESVVDYNTVLDDFEEIGRASCRERV